ncbi:MAG: hypothetical protein KatS3mg102_0464 [Planctomycetota bacterium]|nr:MAG: hypothetical protein KatS3mg102_0464 [Planctomycetota bacterium]
MIAIDGIGCAWNYTMGPAFIYDGPGAIDAINQSPMPVVVIAENIPVEELGRIDLTHVYGFVLEGSSRADPAVVFYSNQHRATVIQARGVLQAVSPGTTVVVDGVEGKVFIDPDEPTRQRYEELRRQGPPPEPPGFADQLLKDTMELRGLDPEELKKGFIDFQALEKAMGTFLKMYHGEELSKAELDQVKAMVKGSPYEERVAGNLERYQEAARQIQAQGGLQALAARAEDEAEEAEGAAAGEPPLGAERAEATPARRGRGDRPDRRGRGGPPAPRRR